MSHTDAEIAQQLKRMLNDDFGHVIWDGDLRDLITQAADALDRRDRDAVIEECAKVVEDFGPSVGKDIWEHNRSIADSIRSLKKADT